MTIVISVSGKGGAGKTTLAALLLKTLLEEGVKGDILVVDADPATNLPDTIGVEIEKTVGSMATLLKKRIEEGTFPLDVSKSELLEAWVFETLVELQDFDMLVMGRTEGEGCYCYVNSVLSRILDTIVENYDIVLMDMEAGLEHISRRTDHDVDKMIIVTDPSKMGLNTARRIRDLTEEVHINVKELYLVGNKFNENLSEILIDAAKKMKVKYGGYIPYDQNIEKYNMQGIPLLKLPADSPSVIAAQKIARKIGLL